MNYSAIFRILSLLYLVPMFAGLLAGLSAFLLGETAQFYSFLTMVTGIVVVSSSTLLLTTKPSHPARPTDALAVVILWWVTAPIACALPFVFGVSEDSIVRGIHEAASCLTTTGHSVVDIDPSAWPGSLLMWRGMLHLIGAWGMVVIVASVFAALNLGGPGIHRTVLFTVPDGSFFDAVPRVARAGGTMIATTTLVIAVALMMSGAGLARSMADAVSAVSTGLVLPTSSSILPVSGAASIVLAIGLLVGMLGLVFWLPFSEGRPGKFFTDPEAVMGAFTLFALLVLAMMGGRTLIQGGAWAISSLSTSGMVLAYEAHEDTLPLSVSVLPALIGGSALSAAGGVKLARLFVLFRRAGQEFQQLGYRRSVLNFKFRDRELNHRSVIGVWVYLIAYILTVFFVMILLSFLGVPFESTVRLSIGALTNSGGLVSEHLDHVSGGINFVLIFAMILGRLEVLALIPALSIRFWRG